MSDDPGPRVRALVTSVPAGAEFCDLVRSRYPGRRIIEVDSKSPKLPKSGAGIVCWRWQSDKLGSSAESLLRLFVYPLAAGGSDYCVGVSQSAEYFAPRELAIGEIDRLNTEDIGQLLMGNGCCQDFHLWLTGANAIISTPIEDILAAAMASRGIPYLAQARVGRFRVDFLVEGRGQKFAIEADGIRYHDAERDSVRDSELRKLGISHVIRFTGSAIYRDAAGCALKVQQILQQAHDADTPQRMDRDLDPSQVSAAVHLHGPARVLAPAGSGKTKTMVNRVVNLIDRGADPNGILVLAFNKKAREQLEDRLSAKGIPRRSTILPAEEQGVLCATFNAFGFRYQRDLAGLRWPIKPEQSVWTQLMSQALHQAGHDLKKLKPKTGSDPMGALFKAMEKVRNDLADPDSQSVMIQSTDGTEIPIPFGPVYRRFGGLQVKLGAQSFDDNVYLALIDLMRIPEHRVRLQNQFEHVLVDEFQDLNAAQLLLLDILTRPSRNVFVVGDDDQLIYGWRGARPENILDFHDRMPPQPYSATHVLEINYRSSESVVAAANRLIAHNRRRVLKNTVARTGAPTGAVLFELDAQISTRMDALVRFIRGEHERLRCRWADLAVLVRYNQQQLPVALALDAAKIPRTQLLKYRLFTDRTARILRSYLRFVLEPKSASREDLELIANAPNRYIPHRVVSDAPDGKLLEALVEWYATVPEDERWKRRAVPALIGSLSRLSVDANRETATSPAILGRIIDEFGLRDYWRDRGAGATIARKDEADAAQVGALLEMVARDHPQIPDFLLTWDQQVQLETTGEGFAADTLGREEAEDRDAVVIGSIHSSKGREYDAVAIVDYSPDLSSLAADEFEEERRVLYVGTTRGRQSVLLTSGDDKLHQLLAELIRKPDRYERGNVEDARRCQLDKKREFLVGQARLTEKVANLKSGEALRGAEGQLDQAMEAIKWAEASRGDIATELDRPLLPRIRQIVSGRRRQLWRQLGEADVNLGELSSNMARLEDESALLRQHPEFLVERAEEELSDADQALREIGLRIWSSEARLKEIATIGATG